MDVGRTSLLLLQVKVRHRSGCYEYGEESDVVWNLNMQNIVQEYVRTRRLVNNEYIFALARLFYGLHA